MTKKKGNAKGAEKLVNSIVAGMQEKKANRITVIDLRTISNPLADYFVICSGSSDKQVDAITESVEKFTHQQMKEDPWRVEGKSNYEWVIMDYVNVIAHVFTEKKRDFYRLEELWGDGKIQVIEDFSPQMNSMNN